MTDEEYVGVDAIDVDDEDKAVKSYGADVGADGNGNGIYGTL